MNVLDRPAKSSCFDYHLEYGIPQYFWNFCIDDLCFFVSNITYAIRWISVLSGWTELVISVPRIFFRCFSLMVGIWPIFCVALCSTCVGSFHSCYIPEASSDDRLRFVFDFWFLQSVCVLFSQCFHAAERGILSKTCTPAIKYARKKIYTYPRILKNASQTQQQTAHALYALISNVIQTWTKNDQNSLKLAVEFWEQTQFKDIQWSDQTLHIDSTPVSFKNNVVLFKHFFGISQVSEQPGHKVWNLKKLWFTKELRNWKSSTALPRDVS